MMVQYKHVSDGHSHYNHLKLYMMTTNYSRLTIQAHIYQVQQTVQTFYYAELADGTTQEELNKALDIASDEVNDLRLRINERLTDLLRTYRTTGNEVQTDFYARALARIRSSRDMMEFINTAIGIFGIDYTSSEDELPF